MLNEEKVKLMTKLALYEQKEGKKAFHTNNYYKADYVSLHTIYTIIIATISFGLLLLIWVICQVDSLMAVVSRIGFLFSIILLAAAYILYLFIHLIISRLVFAGRYSRNKKELTSYNENLKELQGIYREEIRAKEEKSAGGSDTNVDPFDI